MHAPSCLRLRIAGHAVGAGDFDLGFWSATEGPAWQRRRSTLRPGRKLMTDLLAARSQMAMSLAFHIVFACAGIAMPLPGTSMISV